jgi:Tfp pilus assembly protein PilX
MKTDRPRGDGAGERGMAMIIALFMVLVMTVLGTSLMFVSRAETLSSHNYRLSSQARYGAESGLHMAANYLMSTAYAAAAPGTAGDPLSNYNTTASPVTYNGQPVVLSANPAHPANYPVAAVTAAFSSAAQGTLSVNNDSPIGFEAYATLRSMRQFNDSITGQPVTIQTWDLVSEGDIAGARSATVEVASTLERQPYPIYSYAAFATNNGCAALSFAGGATTNSYDSTAALAGGAPVISNSCGNVGTNGNLTEVANPTTINGSLSTPRAGVGACTSTNVTAWDDQSGTLTAGITQLSQPISYPTPPLPSPMPPTTNVGFTQNGGCPSGVPGCTVSANGATLTPASVGGTIVMGDLTTNGSSVIHLNAGTYIVNSVTMNGNSKIVIDSGPVIVQVAGVGQSTPISITGQGLVNPSFKPTDLQFMYAGTGEVKLAGGDNTAGLFYAPNAVGSIMSGGADLYGAIVVATLTETGGAALHYDRHLNNAAVTAGSYTLTGFTWKSY